MMGPVRMACHEASIKQLRINRCARMVIPLALWLSPLWWTPGDKPT
tara:strand:+ start:800 stop:937 length:138 start_codon:yes stop_codon:yes gene_type:complete